MQKCFKCFSIIGSKVMNAIGIIPARLGATRFPGKPLAKILGIPMIGHCYYRTKLALGSLSTYVATCDKEIAHYIDSIAGNVVMTSSEHTRATTRTAEALEHIEKTLKEKNRKHRCFRRGIVHPHPQFSQTSTFVRPGNGQNPSIVCKHRFL